MTYKYRLYTGGMTYTTAKLEDVVDAAVSATADLHIADIHDALNRKITDMTAIIARMLYGMSAEELTQILGIHVEMEGGQ